jgi:uncharacterized RDD family membrane protein YckC
MKCPKCHYLGFASGERCRNCGYDFSLSSAPADPSDLPIRPDESLGPMGDLALHSDGAVESDASVPAPAAGEVADADLPLFLGHTAARELGVGAHPRSPRAPLSVRRATPEVARVRTAVRRVRRPRASLKLDSATPGGDTGVASRRRAAPETPAPRLRRLLAAGIDLCVLAGIDAGVVLLTLRLCGLAPAAWGTLSLPPLVGFLALLNGGYLVAFTAAGGQTLGKMVCGIKVVGADGKQVTPSAATVRAIAFLISVLPLGVGFFAQFVDRQRRALHDRLAETRVVKVS